MFSFLHWLCTWKFHSDVERKITEWFDSLLSITKCQRIQDISETFLNGNQDMTSLLVSEGEILSLVDVLDSTRSVLRSTRSS